MKKGILIVTIFCLLQWGCKSDTRDAELIALEQKANTSKTSEDIEALMKYVINAYNGADSQAEKIRYIKDGLRYAKTFGLQKEQRSFELALVSHDPSAQASGEILVNLCKNFFNEGKLEIATIMYDGISKNFEKMTPQLAAVKESLIDLPIDTMLYRQALRIFNDSIQNVDKTAAFKYIDMCEAYALSHAGTTDALAYLFKGAEMARSIQSYQKAFALYDLIIDHYPTSKEAASSLFIKGFLFEQDFNDKDRAKQYYEEFLEKYPNDELAKDVKVLIENLGKTDEEILNNLQIKQEQ